MSIISTLLAGGATGLLGTLFSSVFKFFSTKQANAHALSLIDKEVMLAKAEAERAEKVALIQADAAESKAAWAALTESYKEAATRISEGEHKSLVWADLVRALMRPVLTLGLVILTGIVYYTVEGEDIKSRVVATILYLATTAVLWWFGSRTVEKGGK